MTDRHLILTFGAAGRIAGLVPRELARRGARIRGFVRDEQQRTRALANGVQDVAIGDLADPASVVAAMTGVDAVFYIAPVDLPDQGAIGRRIVEQAVAAGVRRFVFSSVIHPVLNLPNHAGKRPLEAALVSSGLPYTILHPAVLFQNFAGAWGDIVRRRVLAEPWSNETRHSRVDYRDVAEIAASALLEDRMVNGTFDLCAPGEPDRHDIAALLSELIGRPIAAQRVDPTTLGPDADALRPMFGHYDRQGLHGNPIVLGTLLARAPRTLRDYFIELQQKGHSPS